MNAPRRTRSALLALGLAGLVAAPASAQTSYLAISETTGGGKGQVAIYQQNNTTGAVIGSAPIATITDAGSLAAPSGLAVLTNGTGAATDLFIAGLGTGQIFDYHVATSTVSLFADLNGGPYGYPFGMTVDGSGHLFVSAFGSGATPNGAVLQYNNLSGFAAAPSVVYQGNGLLNPTGLTISGAQTVLPPGTVFVNSSGNNELFAIVNGALVQQTFSGSNTPPSAPAGLILNPAGVLFEANFFSGYRGSTTSTGVSSYQSNLGTFTGLAHSTNAYDTTVGGAAGLVFGPAGGQLLASDYGGGKIYQYSGAFLGDLSNESTYLDLGPNSRPTYLAEFTTSATLHSADFAVPEPASLVLLALGAAAGLLARRRLRRSRAAG